MKPMNGKPLKSYDVELKVDIYKKPWGTGDVRDLVKTFNEIHNPQMKMKLLTQRRI